MEKVLTLFSWNVRAIHSGTEGLLTGSGQNDGADIIIEPQLAPQLA
jgi:hypothetical protein